MKKIRIYLSSSSELKEDRDQFNILINQMNKKWVNKGVFLELIQWEDFKDCLSPTRLQDEYNKAIKGCDVFVVLVFTKVGKYTEEEFTTALDSYKKKEKPLIYTYFKNNPINPQDTHESLFHFKRRLDEIGHFWTKYPNIDFLKFHFKDQIEKLFEDKPDISKSVKLQKEKPPQVENPEKSKHAELREQQILDNLDLLYKLRAEYEEKYILDDDPKRKTHHEKNIAELKLEIEKANNDLKNIQKT